MFDTAPHIITFIALMHVRGPAFRDVAEINLGNMVHTRTLLDHAAGRLPPLPKEHEDLIDKLQVAIDPHQSLLAMSHSMSALGKLLMTLHVDVLHNGWTNRS